MISSPPLPLSLSPSQFLGARVATAAPPSPRSPILSPHRLVAAYYSAPAADRPYPLLSPSIPSPSLYDILSVTSEATPQEIKAAYRNLARSSHPDVSGAASAEEFMRIHAAYATLSDQDKRSDYDRKMVVERLQRRPGAYSTVSSPPFGGFSRRSWETDQCW